MIVRTFAIALAVATLAACSSEQPAAKASAPTAAASTAAVIPASLFAAEAPAGAVGVATVRTSAKAGDDVVLSGFVGGRVDPFTEGRAVFLIADAASTPPCTDHCATAWDACCEPKEKLAASTATIQVVDEGGALLKAGLDGEGGLKAGANVVVAGAVRTADAGVFVVDAKSIHVAK